MTTSGNLIFFSCGSLSLSVCDVRLLLVLLLLLKEGKKREGRK